jgi:hypothetical protein
MDSDLSVADTRRLAFAKVWDLIGDNEALHRAVTAYGAAVRAETKEACARILETKAAASTMHGPMLIDDTDPDIPRRLFAAAIRQD